MTEKTTVEIKGCKFEVDLSKAKKIEDFRLGDRVKVLKKEYGDKFKVYPGVIVGFEWFETLPTITIAYLDISYSGAEINFLHYNEKCKDVEISHSHNAELLIEPADVISKIDGEIEKKKQEIDDLKTKKQYFLKNFGKYFNEFTSEKLGKMVTKQNKEANNG